MKKNLNKKRQSSFWEGIFEEQLWQNANDPSFSNKICHLLIRLHKSFDEIGPTDITFVTIRSAGSPEQYENIDKSNSSFDVVSKDTTMWKCSFRWDARVLSENSQGYWNILSTKDTKLGCFFSSPIIFVLYKLSMRKNSDNECLFVQMLKNVHNLHRGNAGLDMSCDALQV